MGCGCGGSRPKVPTTSGDHTPVPGMPRFKVIRATDDGEEIVDEFATYREARLAQASSGGKLRAIR